jgi:hypothetical protein
MLATQSPPWPKEIPRVWRDVARVRLPRPLTRREWADAVALDHALGLHDKAHAVQASGLTGMWTECFFTNVADHTAVASSAVEASLLAGTNMQPTIPALFFSQGGGAAQGRGRKIGLYAKGVLGTTGTPTIIFQWRLSSTAGSATLSGASVGVSAAITTGSGVTNKQWECWVELICRTPGLGTNNTTLAGCGWVKSPTGFASPFLYPLQITTPDTATWTATIDGSLTQFVNLSCTWSASSASNTCQCKELTALGFN